MDSNNNVTVGFIAPFPFPSDRGSPIRAKNLADLAASEFRVNVCTYHVGNEVETDWEIRRIPDIPVTVSEAGASWSKVACDAFLIPKILEMLYEENIDIIHAHLHEGCFAAQLATKLKRSRIPILYDAHGTLVKEMIETNFMNEDSIQRPFWEFMETQIQESADYVVAQSQPRKRELVKSGLPPEKITVIPDFVDTTLFEDRPFDQELAAEHNISGEDRVIIYTGTLQDYQGIPDLIDAFEKIATELNDAVLLLVGGGDITSYKETAAQRGLEDSIRFTGRQPFARMPSFLSLADVAVGPRRYGKNLPSKLLTYMASGVPTISTEIEGISGVIEHDKNGIVVPVRDPETLAESIVELLNNKQKRERIGKNGMKLVNESYSRHACRESLSDLYTRVLNSNS